MVMEAKPSPQSVGREFVRQYYTLLNKAPDHLHRFYNQSSSFIHGGLDSNNSLVVGQKNIHDKIQQLGFRDCHAKISHVDAQATLGEGVVVQVSGELSNDGQPMRRFTQTFVLACQSPKKYYVHNDIFRYQDIYTDDDESGRGEGTEDEPSQLISEQPSTESSTGVQTAVLIQQPSVPVVAVPNANQAVPQQPNQAQLTAPNQQSTQPPQGPVYYTAGVIANPPQNIVTSYVASPNTPATAQVNGVAAHDDILKNISTQTPNMPSVAVPNTVQAVPAQTMTSIPVVSPQTVMQQPTIPIQQAIPDQTIVASPIVHQTTIEPVVAAIIPQPPVVQQAIPQQNAGVPMQSQQTVEVPQQIVEPALVPQASAVPVQSQSQQQITYVAEVEVVPSSEEMSDGNDVKEPAPVAEKNDQRINDSPPPTSAPSNLPKSYANLFKQGNSGFSAPNNDLYNAQQASPPQAQTQQQQQQQPSKYQPADTNQDMQSGSGARPTTGSLRRDGQVRQRTNTFNDSHQLFFGNVPHRATEDELRDIFSKFGRVVDLRIHTKSTAKNSSSRPLPNYGFITFEDQQSVQNCLNATPIWFPDSTAPNASKLNIEEKKRQNTPREGRRDGRERDGNGRNTNGMNRGGSGNRGDRDRERERVGGTGGSNRPPFNRQDRGSIGPRSGGGGGSNGTNYNNNRR